MCDGCWTRSRTAALPSTEKMIAVERHCEKDGLYAWIKPHEESEIRKLRGALSHAESDQLQSEPEDIKHDIMMCRFLRGHGGTAKTALPALQSFLRFREQNRESILRARRRFDPRAVDYRAERSLHSEEMNERFVQCQVPPWLGSNDGMPVSLLVSRFFDVRAFVDLPDQKLWDWFLSCVEQRNLTLHNQSVQEKRICRVVEARDCMGFSLSSLLSPRSLWKLRRTVIRIGKMYPELLGRLVIFNLEPGLRAVKLIQSLVDEQMRDKILFMEVGDWQSTVCHSWSLSPSTLPLWTRHMQSREMNADGSVLLGTNKPMAVLALPLEANTSFHWRVSIGQHAWTSAVDPCIRVSVLFFEKGTRRAPEPIDKPVVLAGNSAFCCGTKSSPEVGTILLEACLLDYCGGGEDVSVTLQLAAESAGRTPDLRPDCEVRFVKFVKAEGSSLSKAVQNKGASGHRSSLTPILVLLFAISLSIFVGMRS
eukprot:TRINITY_DN101795_c0_g1_i1.p1 TRINITY_DN101795_c0_g1~~TRINITY_DN101795_c0_g1_i1.p1  ORF type:complete len:480 (-),score=42.60 TRINITY_DN101795_c0_g1_i1:196-1635(-)